MKVSQLMPSVRKEVEKPFEEKLARAKQLVRMFANKNACVSCSFGKDSTVVLWLCLQENPKIPVIYNNTGVEFSETLALKEKLKESWNLNLIETKPIKSFWQIPHEEDEGKRGKNNPCCYFLKDKPMKDAMRLHGFTHSFTGMTAIESRLRMFVACQRGQEYYVKRYGYWKIHPILYWIPEEVWTFITEMQIPVNLAYAKYELDRLGCVPCTSYKGWRGELARKNLKMYRLVQERYFHQRLLDAEVRG
jgi:phosphoadenosine phosphosulfate reductase